MSAKWAAVRRGDLLKEKAPAIGGGPESCCELRSTLLRARPEPPSVVPEEAKVINRAKREVAHGAKDIIGLRKCKGCDWDLGWMRPSTEIRTRAATRFSGKCQSTRRCRGRGPESPSPDPLFSDC